MEFYNGYEPIKGNKFIRRIPFYFYVNDSNKYNFSGDLHKLLDTIINERMKGNFTIERFYEELEYMFCT